MKTIELNGKEVTILNSLIVDQRGSLIRRVVHADTNGLYIKHRNLIARLTKSVSRTGDYICKIRTIDYYEG